VRGRGSLAREYTVTYRAGLERNETVVAGAAWAETPSEAGEVSIEESIRDRFGIQVGDTMRFDVVGRTVSAKVVAVRHVEWRDSRAGGFMFVFRPGLLDRAPHGHIAFVRGPETPAARAQLMSALAAGFPNVSVIDGREMLSALKAVVDNVTLAVTVVGTLVVVSGLLILVGAVAMTKFRRVYEAAILKTLGATRQIIATMLFLEYGVLGALAGVLGAAGAAGLTWALSRFAFEIPWRPLPALLTLGVVASGVVVSVVGVAASWDVLQKKPLATLRGQ
jgi:putative ABC transport system permease protein